MECPSQWYNVLDEEDRFCGVILTQMNGYPSGQYDTHTFSYLHCRMIEKELVGGQPIGLETLIIKDSDAE